MVCVSFFFVRVFFQVLVVFLKSSFNGYDQVIIWKIWGFNGYGGVRQELCTSWMTTSWC